ncbi:MAG: phosphotransferase [Acidimicrobiales bacterium]
MTAVEVQRRDGSCSRLVVRARESRSDVDTSSMGDEFRLLVRLQAMGLPTPVPRWLDESGDVLPEPYSVLDYVDGSPRFVTPDARATASTFATELAAIHRIDGSRSELADLPRRTDVIAENLTRARAGPDEPLREGLIREVLGRHWPPSEPLRLALLHGDFWPGNVLWAGDDIVAVIDWEEASVGDPLADVGVTRLDLLWVFGETAMATFTDEYLGLGAPRPADLALWDLVAALRPAGALSSWAADWVDLGRPDITRATMQADHHGSSTRR